MSNVGRGYAGGVPGTLLEPHGMGAVPDDEGDLGWYQRVRAGRSVYGGLVFGAHGQRDELGAWAV